ncbi:MAG TPA: hypothetical protein VNR18_07190, partial [Hyphomicrobiales bacterium]|nr:hypothetical protein [Hyphomicrobiales bacterium]
GRESGVWRLASALFLVWATLGGRAAFLAKGRNIQNYVKDFKHLVRYVAEFGGVVRYRTGWRAREIHLFLDAPS